jgi:polysaccharide deacetylase family protein (PEP-CTERM system associated)
VPSVTPQEFSDITISPELANKCIFSVDVEDWFHILQVPGTPEFNAWDTLPSRVERNSMLLLDLFAESDVRVTCFFLGWVAERFPHLVMEAADRGHEIASHGYAHRLVFEMTAREFRDDALRARRVLEDVTGRPVRGFRCAGFSAIEQTDWFYECLLEAGYEYDSSIFPAAREHGGIVNARRAPHTVLTQSGSIVEFPITVANVCGRAVCFFGGGYLRLFPYSIIRHMAHRVLSEGRPVILYIHPREIDPEHPRLAMPLHRKFKSYVNLGTTAGKIRQIISDFPLLTFQEFLDGALIQEPPSYQLRTTHA